jgi:hypothetical protein
MRASIDPQFLGWLAWILGLAVLAAAGAVRVWCEDQPDDKPGAEPHGDVPTIPRDQAAIWAQASTWEHRA